ncbi:MAG: peptide chain release factor N(5)-glutamine methyltransferase [Actinobacteria bacterium]|nr:peptide chain release factor N(5)-glutamine methyltransferase [Actinomycetota bacterium]
MACVLRDAGLGSFKREAAWLVEAATGIKPAELFLEAEGVEDASARRALELAHRRSSGEPLQYVTGVAAFRYLELAVGPGVFIPRPETELVAERAMSHLRQGGTVVDVGTGSGAIALSLAHERPAARVIATESSTAALAWATSNRARLDLDVELIECDLLSGLTFELEDQVDVIVANPPYVRPDERPSLERDVVDYEPAEALFAGENGLRTIRRLGQQARRWLRPGGWMVVEIGAEQSEAVRDLLGGQGYEEIGVHEDLAGRPRIAEARRIRS